MDVFEKAINEHVKDDLKEPRKEKTLPELVNEIREWNKKNDPVFPFIPTKRTKATIKVMLSHDYNYFEAQIELSGDNITLAEIDNARKDCQRLCDKAVGQYKKAKSEAIKQTGTNYERQQLRNEVAEIMKKPESQWDLIEKAKVKTLSDYDHQTRYNYDDDGDYHPF